MDFDRTGNYLATASGTLSCQLKGDTTVRIWDMKTRTLAAVGRGSRFWSHYLEHKNWVLSVKWSPDGRLLASGGMDGNICIWRMASGVECVAILKGHSKWITSISWEPAFGQSVSTRIASASKDGTAKVWDVVAKKCTATLSRHSDSVTCVRWSKDGHIFTCSKDKTAKMWTVEVSLSSRPENRGAC